MILRQKQVVRLGLTLVELMVAVVLSAMLLGSLVGVLAGIRQQAEQVDSFDRTSWRTECVDLIRRDLLAAESIWFDDGTLWIFSDPPAYQTNQDAIRTIAYQIKQTSTERWLLERMDAKRSQVLAIGPRRIQLERIDNSGFPQPLPPRPGPMPAQVHLWIWGASPTEPIIDTVVVLK